MEHVSGFGPEPDTTRIVANVCSPKQSRVALRQFKIDRIDVIGFIVVHYLILLRAFCATIEPVLP